MLCLHRQHQKLRRKFGKTYKVKETQFDKYYRFTVPEDGIVFFDGRKMSDDSSYLYTRIKANGDSYKLSREAGEDIDLNFDSANCILLKKGTYYFYYSVYDKGSFRISYYKKPADKPNYCMKKAILLPKNKEIIVFQQGAMKYDRWYKIKLTKKKSLAFATNDDNLGCISLYDAKGKEIETLNDSADISTAYSKSRLKKGTYYFRISPYSPSHYSYDIVLLKWW